MTKNEIINVLKKEGIARDIIGYLEDEKTGYIFPSYKPFENPHDEPTSGSVIYYSPKDNEVRYMTFLEFIGLGKLKEITF